MSMADRDGWIWYDGKMVPWRDATTHVLTHTLHYGMGVFEGVTRLQDPRGSGDLPPARSHRPPVPLGADLRDEDSVHEGSPRCRAARVRARQQARVLLSPSAGVLRLGGDGCRRQVEPRPGRDFRLAVGRVPGRRALEKGIRVKTSSFTHHHPNITMCNAKAVCNYAVSILANQEAAHDGYEEAMLLDPQGFICQGSGENVFIVRDGKLHTPDLSGGALNGITRDTIITFANELDIPVIERRITRDEIYICDEAFFTGTAAEVTPIRELDNRTIGDGGRGPVTARLQKLFFDTVNGRNPAKKAWLTKV